MDALLALVFLYYFTPFLWLSDPQFYKKIASYMHWKPKYDPILPQAKDWPIVKLSKARKAFLQAVGDQAVQDILALQADQAALRQELSKSLADRDALC